MAAITDYLFFFQMRKGFEIFPKYHLTCTCKVIFGGLLKRGSKMRWKFWVQGYLLSWRSSAQIPHFQRGWHPLWRLQWLSWWRTWRGACGCNFEYSAVFCWEEMKHFWIASLLKSIIFIFTVLFCHDTESQLNIRNPETGSGLMNITTNPFKPL